MNNLLNGKSAAMMLALSLVNVTAAFAQDDNSSAKEEGNRNVMLNAASANGPREIQIGLPSADVNVLENGLPVTYATNPHSVNTIWRRSPARSTQTSYFSTRFPVRVAFPNSCTQCQSSSKSPMRWACRPF